MLINNLFLVKKKDGDTRLLINLENLNNFLPYHHFKIESLHLSRSLLQRNNYICKINLKHPQKKVRV